MDDRSRCRAEHPGRAAGSVGRARRHERAAEIGGGLVAGCRALGHGPQHHRLEGAGDARSEPMRWGGLDADVLEGGGQLGVCLERRPAADHLVQHDTQGVDV